MICSYIAQKWPAKLEYEYKDICKDIFIDGHEQADVVGDYKNVLKRLEELKLYMIEFEEDSIMKSKIYAINCIIRGDE